MTGRMPVLYIDHINGDTSDNRFCNLREATNSLNQQNQKKAKSTNSSGFLGVSKHGNGYMARIHIDGKTKCLGTFDTPEVASNAYLSEKITFHAA